MMEKKADYVFEVSWEVCNFFGGINTVITSKSSLMMQTYKNYYMIGPYFEKNAKAEFVEMEMPGEFQRAFNDMKSCGIICHYGKWLKVKGKPYTVLIETARLYDRKNEIKTEFWNEYKIDSLRAGWDFEEPAVWSYAVGMLIDKIARRLGEHNDVVAHFHEWLCGFGLLYLHKYNDAVATVFTTHATVLGRCLCEKGVDIYSKLESIDPAIEAYNNFVEAKHTTEMATARQADVFTTVSEITEMEAQRFLGRKPEVLVLNGLEISKYPDFDEISIRHMACKELIREFLTYYFFPYYTFDIESNVIAYTFGRFEYSNKGYDLIVKALSKLNERLKKEQDSKTMTMIFWVPMQQYGVRLDVLENKNYYTHIKNYVSSNAAHIHKTLIHDFIASKDNIGGLLAESFVSDMRKEISTFSRSGEPPLSTHNIDSTNKLLIALRENNLLNRKEDKVKVVIEPVYIDGNDGIFDMPKDDIMIGCDLGLFPSYYEPWGYTPLESAAFGVAALTTDLAGFGRFIKPYNENNTGIMVLGRLNRDEKDVVEDFCNMLMNYMRLSSQESLNWRLQAKSLSAYADWEKLIANYVHAHSMALGARIRKTT